MPPESLSAHGLAEVFLYLMVTPCLKCGDGPLEGGEGRRKAVAGATLTIEVPIACRKCGHAFALQFRLPEGAGVDKATGLADFNPTEEPSNLIDLAQWLTLFHMIAAQASEAADKADGRRLGLEAAQCLEEALKFYHDDNDLPPRSAFFADGSRKRLDEHPEEFSRRRILNLRAKLPTKAKMVQSLLPPNRLTAKRPAKRWWRPW